MASRSPKDMTNMGPCDLPEINYQVMIMYVLALSCLYKCSRSFTWNSYGSACSWSRGCPWLSYMPVQPVSMTSHLLCPHWGKLYIALQWLEVSMWVVTLGAEEGIFSPSQKWRGGEKMGRSQVFIFPAKIWKLPYLKKFYKVYCNAFLNLITEDANDPISVFYFVMW